LVQPLTVAIDEQQRLMAYRGVANVRDEHGDTPQVVMHYRYPAPTAGDSAVSAAPVTPLAATPHR
jgi:hypothetical protein